MERLLRGLVGLATMVVLSLAMAGCATPESPARAELRSRLAEATRLTDDELGRLCDELAGWLEGKTVRITAADGTPVHSPEQRADVFSLLQNRAGLFDEGLRREDGTAYRILNAPGRSDNAEIEATQRLWIALDTLQPRRYEFTYAFVGYGDYAYDLRVEP